MKIKSLLLSVSDTVRGYRLCNHYKRERAGTIRSNKEEKDHRGYAYEGLYTDRRRERYGGVLYEFFPVPDFKRLKMKYQDLAQMNFNSLIDKIAFLNKDKMLRNFPSLTVFLKDISESVAKTGLCKNFFIKPNLRANIFSLFQNVVSSKPSSLTKHVFFIYPE